ncbi:hypothetical protein B7755_018170 [Streptomyces sp. NBS 14/10]|uniref:hypothetical protein n=1 Tax=Streptomyces sp. NBS 14/10 TaxID=1945643 RepID=UPI000B7ED784|nr:hypothetical protein [Streptomyces sp. NBS 14/10]KAK1179896.1 hypothetical protein B7755_018170 [Streptomyces sp. NBS 14/10]NUS87743.1 hypothetical protein [Streptomyces sp.]
MMRRGLRLTAVLAVVLVALTGFKSRGHGRHGSGGGGGCSSSNSSHSSSSSGGYSGSDDYDSDSGSSGSGSGGYRYHDRYDDNDSSSSSGSSSGSSSKPGELAPAVAVVKCAGKDKNGEPAATVKVTNQTDRSQTYIVTMDFRDKDSKVTSGSAHARFAAKQTKTVKVPLDDPGVVGTVVTCEVVSVD